MHNIDLPFLTRRIDNFLFRLRCQLWHCINHVCVFLKNINFLIILLVDVCDVATHVINLKLFMDSMSLRLIMSEAWLRTMMIGRQNFWEWVIPLKASIHHSWLIRCPLKITMLNRKTKLRRFKIVVTISDGVSLPILWNLPFILYRVFLNNQFLIISISWW